MKEFAKLLFNNKNITDEMADNLAQSIGATDNSLMAPSLDTLTKNKELADLLIPALDGSNKIDSSELTAIILYMRQKELFESIGELMMKVALVEMWHYALLQEAIKKLSGNIIPSDIFSSSVALEAVGTNELEALDAAIESESQTIFNYQLILDKLDEKRDNNSEIILQLINKLIADENLHLSMFVEAKNELIVKEVQNKTLKVKI